MINEEIIILKEPLFSTTDAGDKLFYNSTIEL